MAKDLFRNLNLNLLRTFLVIYQENNLQKASVRLNVSPPALTKSLNNLRDHFDDRLFVKVPSGLSPTPFAEKLYDNILPSFDNLAFSINALHEFDPSVLKGEFSIAVSPCLLQAIGKDLFTEINKQAPELELHLINWSKTSAEDIQNGHVRFGINYDLDDIPKEIIAKQVARDQFKLYMRKNHPLNGEEKVLRNIAKYPIATLLAADWNTRRSHASRVIEKELPDVKPNIVFRSELPSAIFEVISDSDILFPTSQYVHIERHPQLTTASIITTNESFVFEISIFYHYRNKQDPILNWLANIVERIFSQHASINQ
ncbi:LysR family transcriptional regulator [Vibrio hannami]|uniref:LysR family transcriptional regulator n=1 Tax=Vibrio hannami TaxID=2717094 RepID=UPI00240FD976|nr:LysR family transcriptional regulator [Vibrio hannami]MDG3087348.1 LysR family transcriptional regulator [Vibrio hannami]